MLLCVIILLQLKSRHNTWPRRLATTRIQHWDKTPASENCKCRAAQPTGNKTLKVSFAVILHSQVSHEPTFTSRLLRIFFVYPFWVAHVLRDEIGLGGRWESRKHRAVVRQPCQTRLGESQKRPTYGTANQNRPIHGTVRRQMSPQSDWRNLKIDWESQKRPIFMSPRDAQVVQILP